MLIYIVDFLWSQLGFLQSSYNSSSYVALASNGILWGGFELLVAAHFYR